MFERLFRRRPRISHDSVTFDTSSFWAGGDVQGCRTWFSAESDGIGLYLFHERPDLPRPIVSADTLRAFYVARYSTHKIQVVEVELIEVDGVRSVWTLFKVPQQGHGMTYLASITIPFAAFSFVQKMQCQEHGHTGMREAAVFLKAQAEGRVSIDANGQLVGELGADDRVHDEQFPQHPVSRARRAFARIRPTLKIAPEVRAEPRFIS